jgi:hypothetical protein
MGSWSELQQRGRLRLQMHRDIGVQPKGGGRAGGADRALERVANGLGLAGFGDDGQHLAGSQESGDGDRDGVGGDGTQVGEVTFVDLLLTAGRFEFHHLYVEGVVEVGHRWIVEG